MRDLLAGAACQTDLTQQGVDSFCGQFNPLLEGAKTQIIGDGAGEEKGGLSNHSNSPAQFRRRELSVIATLKAHDAARGLV
jgi:hypothetical protein